MDGWVVVVGGLRSSTSLLSMVKFLINVYGWMNE